MIAPGKSARMGMNASTAHPVRVSQAALWNPGGLKAKSKGSRSPWKMALRAEGFNCR